jgi:hypothetical protein
MTLVFKHIFMNLNLKYMHLSSIAFHNFNKFEFILKASLCRRVTEFLCKHTGLFRQILTKRDTQQLYYTCSNYTFQLRLM